MNYSEFLQFDLNNRNGDSETKTLPNSTRVSESGNGISQILEFNFFQDLFIFCAVLFTFFPWLQKVASVATPYFARPTENGPWPFRHDPLTLHIPSSNSFLLLVKIAYTENFQTLRAELLELSSQQRETISEYCSNFIVYSY